MPTAASEHKPTRRWLPLQVAIVAVLATPIGGFMLGAGGYAGKRSRADLWLAAMGAIPVLLGLASVGKGISMRSFSGIWIGVFAILLGLAAIYLGWMGLIIAALQRDGILF